ncbi:MAG: thiamine-phosphate kinase [Solirubrobacterales bacterium]
MGEFELLSRLRRRLPPSARRVILGSGDDAAVSVPGGATATSVDASVDGVHFRREQMTPAAIGRRALAVALSDLAAMGAGPGEAYTILGLPPDLGEEEALEILDGMSGLASELAVTLAGGDLTRSPVLALGVTVVGHAAGPGDLIARSGATPGDVLLLSGEIGGAAAGLLLAERPQLDGALAAENAERLRRRLLDPSPRLAEGAALAASGATAMIDISDGLGADAGHLAEASGVGLRIDADLLPIPEGVDAVARAAGLAGGAELAVSGGEDYELLASVPEERAGAAMEAVRAAGCSVSRIGEVVAGGGVEISSGDGRRLSPGGFDQLA